MEIFILLLVVGVIAFLMPRTPKTPAVQTQPDVIVQDVTTNCPPHKWRYVEVQDHHGNTHGWRVVCDLCGPLKPIT